jgi:hypothetical protein
MLPKTFQDLSRGIVRSESVRRQRGRVYFFKLVDSEDSLGFFSVGSSFTTETGTVASVAFRYLIFGEPFIHMGCRDGLVRGGNQIFLVYAIHDLQ